MDLADMFGKRVRFRFHQTKGSLYAFWAISDENGAGADHLGAGGPTFDGVRDEAHD
jgi:hypothetical protein